MPDRIQVVSWWNFSFGVCFSKESEVDFFCLFLHSWNYCRTRGGRNWFWKLVTILKIKFLLSCCTVHMCWWKPEPRGSGSAPQTWLAAPWVTHAWKTPSHTGTSVTWSVCSGTANQTGLSLRSLIPGLNPQAMNFYQDSLGSLPCHLTSVRCHPITLAIMLCPAIKAKGGLVFRNVNSVLPKHKYGLWVFEKERALNGECASCAPRQSVILLVARVAAMVAGRPGCLAGVCFSAYWVKSISSKL